jgi:hypothetical protein
MATGLLELPQDQFMGALNELGIVGAQRDDLIQQKRNQDSIFGGLFNYFAPQPGMKRANILPMMRPEGMSGLEAITSGQAQPALPGMFTGALTGVARAADAPRAAYAGQIPMQDMASEAGNLAGALTLGGVGAAGRNLLEYDPTVARIFAGPKAATADKSALSRANRLDRSGASRDEIWDQTGWFKGADDKWRFEIDDSGTMMRPAASRNEGDYIPLGEAFSHLPLKNAYPEMFSNTGTAFRYQNKPLGSPEGIWSPSSRSITVKAPSEADMAQARDVALHELSHNVAAIEGFDPGTNPGAAFDVLMASQRKALSNIEDAMQARQSEIGLLGYMPNTTDPQLRNLQDEYRYFSNKSYSDQEAADLYERVTGEVEARNVQKRANMTPAQRKATYPWATEDVSPNEQLRNIWDFMGPQQ